MGINLLPGRFLETGHCLIRGRIDAALLPGIRKDLLEAIAARKRLPDWEQNKYRHHRDFALHVHLVSAGVASMLRVDPFPDLVREFLGENADLQFTSTMTKNAEKPAHVDWHQDSAYNTWPDQETVQFWIAISDSRHDDGCLRILPGSHLAGPVPHIASRTLAADKEIETVDENGAEDVEMEAGDMLLLHRHLQHASWANRSGRPRMALIAGFMLPKREYLDFEKQGAFRFLRAGRPAWSRVTEPEPSPT